MTSGFMFTRIRGMPYVGHDGSWIAGGYQNQFGQEVQVVSMICKCLAFPTRPRQFILSYYTDGILAVSFLMLTIVTPYQKSPARQRTQVYLWTFVNFLVFSILVSLFRMKNRGTFCSFLSIMMLIRNDQGIPSNSYFKRLPPYVIVFENTIYEII